MSEVDIAKPPRTGSRKGRPSLNPSVLNEIASTLAETRLARGGLPTAVR